MGLLEGHTACSTYLQDTVRTLLANPAILDQECQEVLLAEVEPQFTEKDNQMLTADPTREEVEKSVKSSNVNAAPVCDTITSYSIGSVLTLLVMH